MFLSLRIWLSALVSLLLIQSVTTFSLLQKSTKPLVSTYVGRHRGEKAPFLVAPAHQGLPTQLVQRQEALHRQSPGTTTVTNENIFQRMGNAFGGVIVGIVMIIFSVPALWLNEKRNAKYETLISRGAEECREIDADNFDQENTNWIVHVTGKTSSVRPVADEQFNVRYESGVIKLSSRVEIYQYTEVEKSETTERDTLGGGKEKTTRTWQEYPVGWHAHYDSGASFKDANYRRLNSRPQGIEAGTFSDTCERVEFGRGFLLGAAELNQLPSGSTAKLNSKPVCKGNASLNFAPSGDDYYYCGKGSSNQPEVGDVRIMFTTLEDGPTTIVGLQAEGKEPGRAGFLPYRVIRRNICPCCPISEDREKELLLAEAKKGKSDLISEEMWGGIMWCCCCPCNIIQMCCAGAMLPELHHVWFGTLDKAACFSNIQTRAAVLKWVMRLVGWVVMFAGLCLLFGPFTTILEVIPFGIGSWLSSIGNAIVTAWSFMVTLVVATLIIAMAYSMYHPMVGIMAFCLMFLIISAIVVLVNIFR